MKKTKVIEFIQSVGDGGAETLVKDYALLMDRERFDVTVLVLHEVEDSANLRRLRENGVPVIALSSKNDLLKKWWRRNVTPIAPELTADKVVGQTQRSKVTGKTQMPASGKKNIFRKGMHYLRNLFFGLKLLKIVKDTGATVLHAHLEVLEIIGAVSGFLKHVRLFHTCHNVPSIIYIEGERPAAAKLIRTNDLQLVALHSDMEAELNELFGIDNTVTIRNGINMPQFADPGIDGMAKRREIGIPGDAFVLGHVGRFSEQKNHGFLVDVFIEVAKRRENAYLLMIGAGETKAVKAKLRENGLQDRYQILSNRKDINELLKTMDVFVFPSLFEGLSVSLVEAQAAGLRCIVSDRCSEEGFCTETCIPLPLGDPAAWADAVLDPDRKRKTDRKLSDYDMNREIRRLEALYMKAKQAPCSKSAVRDDKKGSSRIEHSKRNIISGVFRQMLNIMLAFVSRTAVLYLLGPQYLGLGSLFTSILTVLNLADLGFTVAVIYVLYKPIAENDHSAICAIMAYLKKTYGIIGTVILVLGLAILPFLRLLISADYPADINIYLLYLLFLLNTVVSYRFFAYKNALLTAMQRNDIVNNVYSLTSLSVKAGQIVVLFLFRNYYIFTMVLVLGTVANNLLVQYFSKKY